MTALLAHLCPPCRREQMVAKETGASSRTGGEETLSGRVVKVHVLLSCSSTLTFTIQRGLLLHTIKYLCIDWGEGGGGE